MPEAIDLNNCDPQVERFLQQMLLKTLASPNLTLPPGLGLQTTSTDPVRLTVVMTINGVEVPAEAVLSEFCDVVMANRDQAAERMLQEVPELVELRRKVSAVNELLQRAVQAAHDVFPKKVKP